MIRIEGRNLADEGFSGANARDMDTGRMSKEAASFLTETIKKAIAPIENTVKTNKVVIAQTASNMAKVIEQNTKEFQTIIQDSGEGTQQELLKLLSMMNDAQKKTGDASVAAMRDVVQQIENLKRSDTTGKLSPLLDLDRRQKEIVKPLGRQTVFGAAFKKLTNVDLRRESALQALSPTKLFGLNPGTSDIIKDAETNAATSSATGSLSKLVSALTPSSDPSSQRAAGTLSKIKTPVVNAQGGRVFTTGIDRESLDNKQVELLEQILEQLKKMSLGGGGVGLSAASLASIAAAVAAALPTILGTALATAGIVKLIDIVKEKITPMWEEFANRPENIGKTDEELTKDLRVENGLDSKASDPDYDLTQDPAYPLMKAKRTGLYDKDYIGNSEVDLNMLASSTDTAQLQAILDDNDLSESDRMRVSRRIEQIKRESSVSPRAPVTPEIAPPSKGEPVSELAAIGTMPLVGAGVLSMEAQGLEKVVSPTADAVNNISSLYDEKVANVINNINNITNNTSTGSTSSPIVVSPNTARPVTWSNIIDSLIGR